MRVRHRDAGVAVGPFTEPGRTDLAVSAFIGNTVDIFQDNRPRRG